MEDVRDWLDELNFGYEILTEEEMIDKFNMFSVKKRKVRRRRNTENSYLNTTIK